MPMDFCTTRAAWMPVAVWVVDFGFSRALRRSDSVRVNHASAVAASARGRCRRRTRFPRHYRQRAGRDKAGGQAERRVVHHRERMRPFLDEADAGIDHRGAVPQEHGADDRHSGEPVRRHRVAAAPVWPAAPSRLPAR